MPVTWRMALSTWAPKFISGSYRLNSGGKTRSGSAAEMKSGLRSSAAMIMSPISRASGVPSAICRLCLALADWWPAVTRPSTHLARSISSWHRATWASLSTFGTWTTMGQKDSVPVNRNVRPAPGMTWEGWTCSKNTESARFWMFMRNSKALTGRYAAVMSART